MQWSEVDRRATRTVPRQCLSDVGMHKSVEPELPKIMSFGPKKVRVYRARPLKDELAALRKKTNAQYY